MKLPFWKKYASVFLVVSFFIGTAGTQYAYSRVRVPEPDIAKALPPSKILREIDFGRHETMASLVWLKIIQDVYTWISENPEYRRLGSDMRVLTETDPLWAYPYAFAVSILPDFGQMDTAIEFGRSGIQNVPNDWRIPYYLAMTYHMNGKDRLNAAKYFDLAARAPEAPETVQAIAQLYGTNKDNRSVTRTIWKTIYDTSSDEVMKTRAKNYIDYIDYLETIERAKAQYKEQTGKETGDVSELVRSGILKQAPVNPFQK